MMRILSKFLKSASGNVALTFGLAAVPVVMVIGAAVDYSQATRLQAKFLLAADNAGLAAAQADVADAAELKKIVEEYLKKNNVMEGNYSLPEVKVVELDDGGLKVTLTTKMNTNLMRVIGRNTMEITATSVIARELGNMDVTLVLDNTGSMSGRKLVTLKKASKELVETLHDSKGHNSVIKIGLVPFADYVNIGMNNRNASWADIDPDQITKVEKTRWRRKVLKEYNCRNVTKTYYRDGVKYTKTSKKCDKTYGPKVKETYWKTTKVAWRGCVGSRNYPWNTRDERLGYKIPGIMNKSCSQPIADLSDDKNEIIKNLNSMKATGATYIPAGLMWGWRMISAGDPLNNNVAGVNGKENHSRAIVLMTDGENTVSPTYPDHRGKSQALANKLTSEICANIKASNEEVTIYTVAFEVNDAATKDMMRSCATSSSHYFNADNSVELTLSFRNIAKSLASLRIAR